ncbi:GL17427 [Drosophila persimilis]|uniref:GL17427 n=1 Tax=Drosophila persimilis TaxID=7234 RepID=B4GGX8_DROPE|nr:GL17427 [Drosophila persimilis]
MLLLGNTFIWLVFAGSDWFALVSNGHEVQVRIPVWNVGNIISRFSGYVNGDDNNQKKKENNKPTPQHPPPPQHPAPPPLYPYPPYPWSTLPTTIPTIPTVNPTEPDVITTLSPEEPSLCDLYPHLPLCQEVKSVDLGDDANRIPTVLSENTEFGSEQQQLTITSEAHSVSSLCFHYPRLCMKPEEAQFVRLTNRNGKPVLLIYPAESEYPLALAKSKTIGAMSGPTRRPSWQRFP